MNGIALALICAVLLSTVIDSAAWCFSKPADAARSASDPAQGSEVEVNFSQLAAKLAPAVVAIRTEGEISDEEAGKGVREAAGGRIGSGFIIDQAGYVLTSGHVVIDAQRIVVTLADERICPATLVGADFLVDVAVLKIGCAGHLQTIPIGDPNRVDLGEPVMAIGNPYGLSGTVSVGIVSATQRYVPGRLAGFIQTDAVLNPGNSGGPLIDGHGHVIGISTAMYTINGVNTGIGFALPIDAVRREIPVLETAGRVAHGWIGAKLHPIATDLAMAMGLKSCSGALVTEVTKGSPAAVAGLQQGDVLLAFDGHQVDAAQQLALFIKSAPVGRSARLTVRRRGGLMKVKVQIRQDQDGDRWLADFNDFPI